MASRVGYHPKVSAKFDIKVLGHNQVRTRRQQQEDLMGHRQGVDGTGIPTGWQPTDMQTAQAGASY
jgi:hypothetical protein